MRFQSRCVCRGGLDTLLAACGRFSTIPRRCYVTRGKGMIRGFGGVLPSSRSRSTCMKTLGKAASCLRSLSSCAKQSAMLCVELTFVSHIITGWARLSTNVVTHTLLLSTVGLSAGVSPLTAQSFTHCQLHHSTKQGARTHGQLFLRAQPDDDCARATYHRRARAVHTCYIRSARQKHKRCFMSNAIISI